MRILLLYVRAFDGEAIISSCMAHLKDSNVSNYGTNDVFPEAANEPC